MKSISFKNFRRFADFPEFKFGDITILVGGNNAGKSTLAKSVMLLMDNFKNTPFLNRDKNKIFNEMLPFRLDANGIHDLKIGTFGRALYYNSEEPKITFGCTLSTPKGNEEFEILFELTPVNKGTERNLEEEFDTTLARMRTLIIHDKSRDITYKALSNESVMILKFGYRGAEVNPELQQLQNAVKEINKRLKSSNDFDNNSLMAVDSISYINQLKAHRSTLKKRINALKKTLKPARKEMEVELEYTDTSYFPDNDQKCSTLLSSFIENIAKILKNTVLLEKGKESQSKRKYLKDQLEDIYESASMLEWLVLKDKIHYIQAHSVDQRTQYVVYDKNDYMAQVIHSFASANALLGTEGDIFLKRWMKEFEIGEDYRITSRDGEAYTLHILHEDGHDENLADAGMGTNQLMSILLQLATLIHQERQAGYFSTIIIEEPEQNLHPALQSKLALLFQELSERYGFYLIIETHSEYLIRLTQVLMAYGPESIDKNSDVDMLEGMKNIYKPFKVYYFPKEGVPYDMEYREDGCFTNEFGTGFFDEASNLAFKLF